MVPVGILDDVDKVIPVDIEVLGIDDSVVFVLFDEDIPESTKEANI